MTGFVLHKMYSFIDLAISTLQSVLEGSTNNETKLFCLISLTSKCCMLHIDLQIYTNKTSVSKYWLIVRFNIMDSKIYY